MNFAGTKEGELINFHPFIGQKRKEFICRLREGTVVNEELTVYRAPKSHKQVKTIFGLMIKTTIEQADDLDIGVEDLLKYLIDDKIPKGQGLTKEFLHELMYVICPTTDENGRRITLSQMDTAQAANLFEKFRNIIAPLGIVINDPDPDWLKKKVKNGQ